jgi:DNA-binding MarR family transcriptional regulator
MARARTRVPAAVDDTARWRPRRGVRTSLLFDVFVLSQRSRALVSEAMRDAPMRPDEYAAYSVIFEEGRITLTDLTRRLGAPLTTVADAVRGMSDRGHVRREPHPTDLRASLLALTPAGLRAHRRASGAFERAHRALSADLGAAEERRARALVQHLADSAERALDAITGGRGSASRAG